MIHSVVNYDLHVHGCFLNNMDGEILTLIHQGFLL